MSHIVHVAILPTEIHPPVSRLIAVQSKVSLSTDFLGKRNANFSRIVKAHVISNKQDVLLNFLSAS